MENKIGNINQNYGAIDFDALTEDLKLASYEEMNDEDFEVAKYKESGVIPNMIKVASAGKFGVKHAYFDIWQVADSSVKGVWVLEKNEAGEDIIVKKS